MTERTPSAQPSPAQALLGQALAAHQGGQAARARTLYDQVLHLVPDHADALNFSGVLHLQQGDAARGVAQLQRAQVQRPGHEGIALNLGSGLLMLGQPGQALAAFDLVLAQQPDHLDALNNSAQACLMLQRPAEALQRCDRLLAQHPELLSAVNLRSHALRDLGHPESATEGYRRVLAAAPAQHDAWMGLGVCLGQQACFDDAIAAFHRAAALSPRDPMAWSNIGQLRQEQGLFDLALQAHQRALNLAPTHAPSAANLGVTLLAMGRTQQAIEQLGHAVSLDPQEPATRSQHLFALNFAEGDTGAQMLAQAQAYGALLGAPRADVTPPWARERGSLFAGPLKVGLVSGDLRQHPVAYFLEGMLAHVDPRRIELIALPTRRASDGMTDRLRSLFQQWTCLEGLNDADAAQCIREAGIDVLIDLCGHTQHHRLPLLAQRPAPLQISWLGYLATTGVPAMDAVLVDPISLPPGLEGQFTERPHRLPRTVNCFTPPTLLPEPVLTPTPALARGHTTFGCFQTSPKVGDGPLSAWADILRKMPQARLRIQNRQLGDPTHRAQFTDRLRAHGVDLARVQLLGPVEGRRAYLESLGEVDVILDTWPYNGITTTCEALWMGVPVLTLAGQTLLSRQGASLLHGVGLPDWVASSPADFTDKAVALGGDTAALGRLRAGLRAQALRSPVFNAAQVAADWQDAIEALWRAPSGS